MKDNKKLNIVILQYPVGDNIDENLNNLISKIDGIKVTNKPTIVISHELSYLKYFPIIKNSKYIQSNHRSKI